MTRLLDWLIRLLLVLLLLPVSYSFLRESACFVLAIPDGAPFIWASVGAAAGFLTAMLFSERVLRLLEAMSHEGKHALVALILGHKVAGIEAYADKDSATLVASPTWLIYLAPYTLPILTLPLLVIRAALPGFQPMIIDILIGLTFMFHLVELADTLGHRQTDLKIVGYSVSLIIIVLVNVVFLIVILAVIQGDLAGLLGYFRRSVTQSPTYYRIEFDLLRRLWTAFLSLSKQFLP